MNIKTGVNSTTAVILYKAIGRSVLGYWTPISYRFTEKIKYK
jgi:hypothetical protein